MKNGLIISNNGVKRYWLNDLLHREDGPAVEYNNGYKAWYLYGERHREGNLPAIEFANGDKSYFIHGEYHREDGPAFHTATGETGRMSHYYLNNYIFFTKKDYWKEIKRRKSLNFILSNLKKRLSNE